MHWRFGCTEATQIGQVYKWNACKGTTGTIELHVRSKPLGAQQLNERTTLWTAVSTYQKQYVYCCCSVRTLWWWDATTKWAVKLLP